MPGVWGTFYPVVLRTSNTDADIYREVAANRVLWTVCDDTGFPAPRNPGGKRVMPFWSSRSRVEQIIKTVPAYSVFEPHEISWVAFCSTWVPDLIKDEMLVGVNWSGKRAVGYEIEPMQLVRSVDNLIEEPRTSRGESREGP